MRRFTVRFAIATVASSALIGCSENFTEDTSNTGASTGEQDPPDAQTPIDSSTDSSANADASDCNPTLKDASTDASDSTHTDSATADTADSAASDSSETSVIDSSADSSDAASCDPTKSPKDAGCVVDEQYGVFVSSSKGDDTLGAGTRKLPYKTITRALSEASAQSKRVYACGETFAELVDMPSSVSLYGALDCSTDAWTWKGETPSVVNGPADASGVMQISATRHDVSIDDFIFQAADAATPGVASVAGYIRNATNVLLTRVKFIAGKGAAGHTPSPPAPGADGIPGHDGYATDVCYPHGGCNKALAVVNQCTDGTSSTGGGSEEDGLPAYPFAPNAGKGANTTWSAGTDGADGPAGEHGPAISQMGIIDGCCYRAVGGYPGTAGSPGQGGGGGASMENSGGGGGTGGCGGRGGPAGEGGGASIGLVVLENQGSVVLRDCVIVAGEGGAGSNGQAGAAGGLGAKGGKGGPVDDCGGSPGREGGKGGNGGMGGSGSGGGGGPSVGIWWNGMSHPMDVAIHLTIVKGAGGLAGKGGYVNGDGADGLSADSYNQKAMYFSFPSPVSAYRF